MENFNHQLLAGIAQILLSKPVMFIFNHSFAIGLITGAISVIPFVVKQLPTLIIMVIALLASFYISEYFNLTLSQALYSAKAYFIATLVGDYIVGSIFGCVVANLIQRIRGEQDHATNN